MKRVTEGGVWEAKLSRDLLGDGNFTYKYVIKRGDRELFKADPYGYFCECPPATASVYHEIGGLQTETVIPIIPQKTSLWDLKIRSFLDAVLSGGPSPVPSSQILYNQAIIDGIVRSAKLKREIEIEIPEI